MLEEVTKENKQNDNDTQLNKGLLEVTGMPAPDLN